MAIYGEQILAFERRFGPALDQVRVAAHKRSPDDPSVSVDAVNLIAVNAERVPRCAVVRRNLDAKALDLGDANPRIAVSLLRL